MIDLPKVAAANLTVTPKYQFHIPTPLSRQERIIDPSLDEASILFLVHMAWFDVFKRH